MRAPREQGPLSLGSVHPFRSLTIKSLFSCWPFSSFQILTFIQTMPNHKFSRKRTFPMCSSSVLSCSRSQTFCGGLLFSLAARFQRSARLIPMHGPYQSVKSNALSSSRISAFCSSDKGFFDGRLAKARFGADCTEGPEGPWLCRCSEERLVVLLRLSLRFDAIKLASLGNAQSPQPARESKLAVAIGALCPRFLV